MYTYREELSAADYNKLREAVGWEALPVEQAQGGLDHSCHVMGCYNEENCIIGAAGILWDCGCIAYLADVMVLPEYQGYGIGKTLVNSLIQLLKADINVGWKVKIVLLASKNREPFYEKIGFISRPREFSGAGMDLLIEGEKHEKK